METCQDCQWFMSEERLCSYHANKTNESAICKNHLLLDKRLYWKEEVIIMDAKSRLRYGFEKGREEGRRKVIEEARNEGRREIIEKLKHMREELMNEGVDIDKFITDMEEKYGGE